MKRKQRIFLSLVVAVASLAGGDSALGTQPQQPPAEMMQKTFAKLVDASCIACHDGSEPNGFDASKLTSDLSNHANFSMWEKVHDQIASGEMPPAETDRPDPALVEQSLSVISKTLSRENLSHQAQFGRTVLRRLTRSELQHLSLIHI